MVIGDPDTGAAPILITQEEMSETGEPKSYHIVDEHPVMAETQEQFQISDSQTSDDSEGARRKYYFDGDQVEIVTHIVHELDPDGKPLRVVKFTDYTAERVHTLYRKTTDLRAQWADPGHRADINQQLAERGINFDNLAKAAASRRLIRSICSATLSSTRP
jgi:type I restriction enzyme R subunit